MALELTERGASVEPKRDDRLIRSDSASELSEPKWTLKRSSSDRSPISSPKSSSGYNSSQSSIEDSIDSQNDESSELPTSDSQDFDEGIRDLRMMDSDERGCDYEGWNQPDPFDPNNPYRDEPLNFPPDHRFFITEQVRRELYAPYRSLPKRLCPKRVSLSPEIKAKLSKRTGAPKKSAQFAGPDSCTEESDSD